MRNRNTRKSEEYPSSVNRDTHQEFIFPKHFSLPQIELKPRTRAWFNILFSQKNLNLVEKEKKLARVAPRRFGVTFKSRNRRPGCFRLNNFTLLTVKLKVLVSSGSLGILSRVLSSNTLLAPLLLKSCGGMFSSEEGSSG